MSAGNAGLAVRKNYDTEADIKWNVDRMLRLNRN